VQKTEFWILTAGKGVPVVNGSACADHGFHTYNRTDVVGTGPLKIEMDKYLPDVPPKTAFLSVDQSPNKSECALKCTVDSIGVYWACAAVCIKEEAPNSCITAGCLAAVAAFDTKCLTSCPKTAEVATKKVDDVFLPQNFPVVDSSSDPSKNKCALKCTVESIGVYWSCAAVCIKELAPNSCITVGCLAAVAAFDTKCLTGCNKTTTSLENLVV